jgi:hypothetical protein
MESTIKQIKIKLNVPESAARYYELHAKWEDEGGASPGISKPFQPELPFEKGDLLRVVSGVVDVRDGEMFYIVDVEKVSEE